MNRKLLCLVICTVAAVGAIGGCTAGDGGEKGKPSESSAASEAAESVADSRDGASAEGSGQESDKGSEEQSGGYEDDKESKTSSSASSKEAKDMTESEAAQASTDGYQFDDEEIVKDYHHPDKFTDNEEFNKIFEKNKLDKEYNDKLKDAMTNAQMLSATNEYSGKWSKAEEAAYKALLKKLDKLETEKNKLISSEKDWSSNIRTVEESRDHEAEGGGTEALLSGSAEILNRYKSRTAVLLEQIYSLEGDIDISEYGL